MQTILLLTISNIFVTFAWYGHLKYRSEALRKVVMASWGIAFFEYCFEEPANRIGSYEFNGAQLFLEDGAHRRTQSFLDKLIF
ncbi:MAG TPA: DMT family protein [Candidatus Acidoferrum sp.]